ncbi:unnamed protein product [Lactuca saligna]|uniref:Reverse transcriptase zinc-binding domain-containing protein n=1 Tax=Lactuca saligna TaxID=75948 RepID=A0AA36ELY0_LACSI|nr:unnamed protein product [Lactuca saligna]
MKTLPGVWNNIACIKNDLMKNKILVCSVFSKHQDPTSEIWKCGLTSDGSYSVCALRNKWDYRTPTIDSNFQWLKEIPLKVSCFTWRAQAGRIPSVNELSKRGVYVESLTCQMCEEIEECLDHTLVACSYATMVTKGILRWCRVQAESFHKVNQSL